MTATGSDVVGGVVGGAAPGAGGADEAEPAPVALAVDRLRVGFPRQGEVDWAVRDVSFSVRRGRILALVGESGSGKTLTALATMRLLPANAVVGDESAVRVGEDDVLGADARELRRIRGARIAMVFQDPMTTLDPVSRVGTQIDEAIRLHRRVSRARARRRTVELLELVGVPDAARRARQYPHQWSGGMRQRAVIAMGLANSPDVLVADEPTTALDVTIQAQVLDVLRTVRDETGTAIVLITHDLGLVAEIADDVAVMYAGRIVERCAVDDLFAAPSHPYTRALMASRPSAEEDRGGRRLNPISGRPPDISLMPAGCSFHPRCPMSDAASGCTSVRPELAGVAPTHESACHRRDELVPDKAAL